MPLEIAPKDTENFINALRMINPKIKILNLEYLGLHLFLYPAVYYFSEINCVWNDSLEFLLRVVSD